MGGGERTNGRVDGVPSRKDSMPCTGRPTLEDLLPILLNCCFEEILVSYDPCRRCSV